MKNKKMKRKLYKLMILMMMMAWMDGKYQLPNKDTKCPKPSRRRTQLKVLK